MKNGIIFGLAMAIIWSVVFVIAMNSYAGIGVGICFGLAFGSSFSKKDKNKKS